MAAAWPTSCASYAAGQRELKLGAKDYEARRYALADQHYARGLEVIKPLYTESIRPSGVIDDTGMHEALANINRRDRHIKQAAAGRGIVLQVRLDIIRQARRCH